MSDNTGSSILLQQRQSSPILKRIVDSYIVIYLDPSKTLIEDSICKLRHQDIDYYSDLTFDDADSCINFLTDVKDQKVFLVLFGVTFGETIMPLIHNIPQLDSIYIFCRNDNSIHNELWIHDWKKIKGVFTELPLMYTQLNRHIQQRELDLTPISIVSTSKTLNPNELDQSFMYSKLLKEILLEMKFDNEAKENFVNHLRILYADNNNQLHAIEKFEQDYTLHSPIWWYTKEFFIYSILNRALRTQDIDIIIKMGFFMRDLHQQIARVHATAYQTITTPTIVIYRGQGMLNVDFEKMKNNMGGLLSFNNFLSTSKNRQVSLLFAESSTGNPDLIGVLFQMKIDPSTFSAPFAALDDISYFADSEEEILFSMHTVFRIGHIHQIGDRLWQVDLALTSEDHDEQLKNLTDHIRKDTRGSTGWIRLGKLMLQMGALEKAEDVYQTLLKMKSEDPWTFAHAHHQLGLISQHKLDLARALSHYEQSLAMKLKYLPSDHFGLSPTYNNIGMILQQQGHLERALEYLQRALAIELHSPYSNQLSIATQYNNIGLVLQDQGKYVEALENYERSLNIRVIHLPSYHPNLAATYANIAVAHQSMADFLTGLLYCRKALDIAEKSLPPNHPLMSQYHHNMATSFESLHRYNEAIEHAQLALTIARQTFGLDDAQVRKYEEGLDYLRRNV